MRVVLAGDWVDVSVRINPAPPASLTWGKVWRYKVLGHSLDEGPFLGQNNCRRDAFNLLPLIDQTEHLVPIEGFYHSPTVLGKQVRRRNVDPSRDKSWDPR